MPTSAALVGLVDWHRRGFVLAALAAPLTAPAQQVETIAVPQGLITLITEPGFSARQRKLHSAWVRSAAASVAGYFGRFPVPVCEVQVQRVGGVGIASGVTFAEPQPYIRVRMGQDTQARQLAADWVLLHEMVHLAVPQVPRSQNWLHEGIATYVQGVASVRAGMTTPQRLWAEFVRGIPQGQPQEGDRGLDHTPTWGRTYWGGAMFCLLADVRLLQASNATKGLREALQGVLAAGGNYAVAWPVRRILEIADQAVSQTTLVALYDAMKDSADPLDLDTLWQQLGVRLGVDGLAQFDDLAPLAPVRRAIA